MSKRLLLCILDGFGWSKNRENPIEKCMRFFPKLWNQYPHTLLKAHGKAVGLPENQFGNSETGHIHIGMGQVVEQDLVFLNKRLKDLKKLESVKRCHIIGLYSAGGVHSHKSHFEKLIHFFEKKEIPFFLHLFADGRDTDANVFIDDLKELKHPVSTISGRFWAMDRDKRWERTEKAFEAIVYGKGAKFSDPNNYIEDQYKKGISDEFIEPASYETYKGIKKDDTILIVNFRSDRILQLVERFLKEGFSSIITMMKLPFLKVNSLFNREKPTGGLGETISQHGLKQLRVAETEKFAHVTYFFNGGVDKPFKGEDRILIPSPKVETYDLKPEMSAYEVTDACLDGIDKKYNFILVNYANPDMVGHTGQYEACCKSLKCVDQCLKKLVEFVQKNDYVMVITSDHGNIEAVKKNEISKQHTCNPVPFIVITKEKIRLVDGGSLINITPTCLKLMDLQIPDSIEGKALF